MGEISFGFPLATESSVLKKWGASDERRGFLAPTPMQEGSRDDLSPPHSPEKETDQRGDKTYQGCTAQSEPAPGLTIQGRDSHLSFFSLYSKGFSAQQHHAAVCGGTCSPGHLCRPCMQPSARCSQAFEWKYFRLNITPLESHSFGYASSLVLPSNIQTLKHIHFPNSWKSSVPRRELKFG